MTDNDSDEMIVLDSDEVVADGGADGEAAPETPSTISELMDEQDEEAQAYAAEFLKKVLRLRGVKVEREAFLAQELRKIGTPTSIIDLAIATTPAGAGVTLRQLDAIAGASIDFETRKSASMSFAAGLPGGLAMLATVPADVTQYYVHAFRVMQKLAYVYGWKDFLGDLDDADDETVGKVAVFLGIMMGVGGAAASFTTFAQQIARPAIQKQITQKTLTKTAWYPVIKQTLKLVGIKVTKDSFAKTVTKVVPVAGGVISGGMTLVSLKSQSVRLQDHLRRLPPPGVDAEEYLAAFGVLDDENESRQSALEATKAAIGGATHVAASGAKDLAGAAASGAAGLAGGAAERAKGLTSGLLRRRHRDEPEG